MTGYVTGIYDRTREPTELQVMHKYPMTEPDTKAGAAQLAGRGPRPDQNQTEGTDHDHNYHVAVDPGRP